MAQNNDIENLCESIVHLDLKCGTNDPSRPSDKAIVNDNYGDIACTNCYITAIVGNSRYYNQFGSSGKERFAQDFNIAITKTKSFKEIQELYTRLPEEEGYKYEKEFDNKTEFLEYINSECEKCIEKKFIFLYHLSAEQSKISSEKFSTHIGGHIVALKIRKAENNRFTYMFIDYQKNVRERCRNKMPSDACPPFCIFEKIRY